MRDLQQNKAVLSVPRVRSWAGPGLNNCILQHDGSLRRSAALPVRSVSVRDWGILRGLIMLRGPSERPQQSQVHLVLCLPLCVPPLPYRPSSIHRPYFAFSSLTSKHTSDVGPWSAYVVGLAGCCCVRKNLTKSPISLILTKHGGLLTINPSRGLTEGCNWEQAKLSSPSDIQGTWKVLVKLVMHFGKTRPFLMCRCSVCAPDDPP